MLKLNSILAPVDFSDRSTVMAQHAAHMAAHFGAHLILAHVDEAPDPYYRSLVAPAQGEMDEHCRRALAKIANRISVGHPVETLLLHGDPARKLEEVVEDRGIELVMMATRGHGSFRRFVMGSVTTKILHDVMCPVFTGVHVPQVAKFTGDPYVRVACAVDLREQSETVLAWAAEFAASWKADLILIHAAPLVSSDDFYGSFFSGRRRRKVAELRKEKGRLSVPNGWLQGGDPCWCGRYRALCAAGRSKNLRRGSDHRTQRQRRVARTAAYACLCADPRIPLPCDQRLNGVPA
jgi:nucleotide-binding universal stress UspA family protein